MTDNTAEIKADFVDVRRLKPFDVEDPRYKVPFKWTLGPNKESKHWRHDGETTDVATMFRRLARHMEDKNKDGLAFVTGDMAGSRRVKTAVKALYAIGLDFDKGTPLEKIYTGMVALGCACIVYTTHSHGKTREEFKRDEIVKWLRDTGQDKDSEIDTDLMRRFLVQKKGWDPAHVATVKFIGVEHENRGLMVHVSMDPMPKSRVVIPLAKPFVIRDVPGTQNEAIALWAKVPPATADLMGLGAALDLTGTDTSRLFYFPRHAKGMPWEIAICGGDLFDWNTLELENPYEKLAEEVGGSKKSKSKTKEGKDLGRWSMKRAHGFQIVDVLENECAEKIRGKASAGVDIECPFDGEHSNAGDPEDRACFAVNAGEGTTDWLTISCRHDSCRDYTMLDMLGRMIADGWFSKDVLESDTYNAAITEDAPQPAIAEKIEKEDKAKEKYQQAIDDLTPDSDDAKVEEVICICLDAGLALRGMEAALREIAAKSDTPITVVRRIHKICAKDMRSDREDKEKKKKEDPGLEIFYHRGEYGFDDAIKACVRVLKEANAKAQLPLFSQFNGIPVRLDLRNGRAEFVQMTHAALWSELSRRLAFVEKYDEGVSAHRKVPEDVARHVYEQGYATLPPAPEVIHVPVYLKGGTLLLNGGYHYAPDDKDAPRNHLLLLNDLHVPPVPKEPTKDDAAEALGWLRKEYLGDFPFCDTDETTEEDQSEPSEANALALLLTPFMRPMIEGRTPLFAIVKPQTGSGATFLAQLAINLLEGFEDARAPLNYTVKEEEMEKTLVSAIKETRSTLFFDDVKDFNNRLLLRSITAARVGGRILGQSRLFERPNTLNWIVTGVNPHIGGEMHRRTCWIRLNPKTPDGTERTFTHAESFYAAHRGLAIRHILTLIEYWLEQGQTEFTDRSLSGFDDWCKKVGGVLAACGVEGFIANKAKPVLDTESMTENEFLQDLHVRLNGGELDLPDVFKWADGNDSAFVVGRTPDERQRNFMDRVIALNGRTFGVTDDTATVPYMVRIREDKDKRVVVRITVVEKEPA